MNYQLEIAKKSPAYTNAYAKVKEWIFDVQFPGNEFPGLVSFLMFFQALQSENRLISRNFETFIFKPKLSFWAKITKFLDFYVFNLHMIFRNLNKNSH